MSPLIEKNVTNNPLCDFDHQPQTSFHQASFYTNLSPNRGMWRLTFLRWFIDCLTQIVHSKDRENMDATKEKSSPEEVIKVSHTAQHRLHLWLPDLMMYIVTEWTGVSVRPIGDSQEDKVSHGCSPRYHQSPQPLSIGRKQIQDVGHEIFTFNFQVFRWDSFYNEARENHDWL